MPCSLVFLHRKVEGFVYSIIIAERELRLFGRYRVLFTVAEAEATVTIVLVGEKRGNSLYVQGKRIAAHESRSTERG